MQFTPTTPAELRAELQKGTCHFAFKKRGGELRIAVGTLNLSLIPKESHPKGVRESSDKVVPFWDFEKGSWRSLSKDSEIFM
jgi:hypothetical protein